MTVDSRQSTGRVPRRAGTGAVLDARERLPVNLYFTAQGRTALRYWRADGCVVERQVPSPAALLCQAADPEAVASPRVLESAEAVLFAAFREMPLCPQGAWMLDASGGFSPLYRETFAALLRMLRCAPEARWCRRGEPGWFLQFGLREVDGSYTMGAFVLPCGKPAVLTFRAADLIEALPGERPFATMDVLSAADGLPEQRDEAVGWDARIRLPIAERGAALVRLLPRS
ncbi:MAG: hypothetical protein ACI4RT_05675 [Candidatus Spyradenecus sp.]